MVTYTAGQVAYEVAILLNDVGQVEFTEALALAYIRKVLEELDLTLQENQVAFIQTAISSDTTVPATTSGAPAVITITDMIEPMQVLEHGVGEDFNASFVPMQRRNWFPTEYPNSTLQYWVFNAGILQLFYCTAPRVVRVHYMRGLATSTTPPSNYAINVPHMRSFIEYRTAALMAAFQGENRTRAEDLNAQAEAAKETGLSNLIKEKQFNPVRRRPYTGQRRSLWRQS